MNELYSHNIRSERTRSSRFAVASNRWIFLTPIFIASSNKPWAKGSMVQFCSPPVWATWFYADKSSNNVKFMNPKSSTFFSWTLLRKQDKSKMIFQVFQWLTSIWSGGCSSDIKLVNTCVQKDYFSLPVWMLVISKLKLVAIFFCVGFINFKIFEVSVHPHLTW